MTSPALLSYRGYRLPAEIISCHVRFQEGGWVAKIRRDVVVWPIAPMRTRALGASLCRHAEVEFQAVAEDCHDGE